MPGVVSGAEGKAPATAAVKDVREKMLDRVMSKHHYSGDALIEVLHAAQGLYGFLTPELLKHIARKLRLPASRVLGVATFYHFFNLEPKGEHTVVVCTGTACYVAGAAGLLKRLETRCCKAGQTSKDGKVSVAQARCIGACGLAPAIIHDGRILPRVSIRHLDSALDKLGVK